MPEPLKGDLRLTPTDRRNLRNAVARKLMEVHGYEAEEFASRGKSKFEDFSRKINECIKGFGAELQSSGIGKSRISGHILSKLFFPSKEERLSGQKFRKVNVAILTLFVYGKVSYLIAYEEPIGEEERGKANELDVVHQTVPIHLNLTYPILKQLFQQAESVIHVLDTYIENWIHISSELRKATERGCKVQILLGKADSSVIQMRNKALGRDNQPKYANTLLSIISNEIRDWDSGNLVEIRLFDQLPGLALYGADKHYLGGWFLMEEAAINLPFLKVEPATSLNSVFHNHFTSLWNQSVSFDPGINQLALDRASSDNLARYIGEWYLYCSKSFGEKASHRYLTFEPGPIARNRFLIEPGDAPDQYLCRFLPADPKLGEHKGSVRLHQNDSFLSCELKHTESNSYLSFLIHIGSGINDHLIGIFNNMYPEGSILGTGLVAVVRAKGEVLPPAVVDVKAGMPDLQTDAILRYLAFPQSARIQAFKEVNELLNSARFGFACLYQGVYKVYSYYKKSSQENRFINQGVMEISPNYTVRQKRKNPYEEGVVEAVGKVEVIRDRQMLVSLHATRIGVFVISISQYKPIAGTTFFGGVFAGISSADMAVGTRLIFEYLGKEAGLYEQTNPDHFQLHSSEFHKLPLGVRENLTGRNNNMIAFVRQQGRIYSHADLLREVAKEKEAGLQLGTLFMDSACQKLLRKELSACIKMVERAIYHGYVCFEALEKEANIWLEKGVLEKEFMEQLLSHPRYLYLKKSFSDS